MPLFLFVSRAQKGSGLSASLELIPVNIRLHYV